MLFPPVIYFLFLSSCFFVCFLDKSSSSEARCGMYEGSKLLGFFFFPRVKRSLVFTSKNTPSSSTSNTKYQKTSPAVYSPHVPFPLETTRIFSPHTRSPLPPTQRECFKVVLYMEKTKKNHLGCTETQHHWPRVIAESASTKISTTMSLTKYPDSYSQRRLLLFSSSRWMGVKFFRSHRQRRRRHFGHCVSGCRSFPVPTAQWCC